MPAGFINVVLHSFVIMIFAFANNVQVVLYLHSRRLERALGSDISLCQRVQPDKIPWVYENSEPVSRDVNKPSHQLHEFRQFKSV